jgi:hypothetical protein
VLRIWKRKDVAIKNWRSRAWSIDPKKTNLTIIKVEASDMPNRLFETYPQYYDAIADMEQLR